MALEILQDQLLSRTVLMLEIFAQGINYSWTLHVAKQSHKMRKTEDVWLNYSQLRSCFHIVMIIDGIQNLTQVHSTVICKSGPKSVLIKSVLGNLSRTENGHNLFMLLYLWPFLLIQWKGVFVDMGAPICKFHMSNWRGTDMVGISIIKELRERIFLSPWPSRSKVCSVEYHLLVKTCHNTRN